MGRADSGVIVAILKSERWRKLFVPGGHPRNGGLELGFVGCCGPRDGSRYGFEKAHAESDDCAAHSFEEGEPADVELAGASREFVGLKLVRVQEHIEEFHVAPGEVAESTCEFSGGGVLNEGRLLDIGDQVGYGNHCDDRGQAGGEGAFHADHFGLEGCGNQRKRARCKASPPPLSAVASLGKQ